MTPGLPVNQLMGKETSVNAISVCFSHQYSLQGLKFCFCRCVSEVLSCNENGQESLDEDPS